MGWGGGGGGGGGGLLASQRPFAGRSGDPAPRRALRPSASGWHRPSESAQPATRKVLAEGEGYTHAHRERGGMLRCTQRGGRENASTRHVSRGGARITDGYYTEREWRARTGVRLGRWDWEREVQTDSQPEEHGGGTERGAHKDAQASSADSEERLGEPWPEQHGGTEREKRGRILSRLGRDTDSASLEATRSWGPARSRARRPGARTLCRAGPAGAAPGLDSESLQGRLERPRPTPPSPPSSAAARSRAGGAQDPGPRAGRSLASEST